jgi:hypothetical protein
VTGRVAQQSAGYPASTSGHLRLTVAESGYTAAAMPEEDVGGSDIALLVQRAAEGDRWAWERLVDQYARLIWAMTRNFKLVESDAADVAQSDVAALARAHRSP